MSCYREIKNNPGLHRRGKTHRHELLGTPESARFSEHLTVAANLPVEMATKSRLAFFT